MIAYLSGLPGWLYAITVGIAVEAAHHKALAATALLAVAAVVTRLRRGRHARLVSRPRMTLVSHGTRRKRGRHEITGPIALPDTTALEASAA